MYHLRAVFATAALEICIFLPASNPAEVKPERASAQFERRQRDQRKDAGENPEADHDLRFGPPPPLEGVVDRRARENPFPGQLEVRHLQHDRPGLHDENPADQDQQHLLPHEHGQKSDRAAEGEAAGVPHEHRSRVAVVPEKPDAAAADRSGEHHSLARNGTFR